MKEAKKQKNQSGIGKKFIEIVSGKEKVFLNLDEVMHIERDARKIRIICKEVEYTTYESLNSLMQRLPENFKRCHTGYIVNLDYVVSVHSHYLLMKNDEKISIGRTYKGTLEALR